jgi:hypothetical protein
MKSHTGSFIPFSDLSSPRGHWHTSLMRVNTARNALRLILRKRRVAKLYLPWYSCAVIHEALRLEGVSMEFYNIDRFFRPIFNYQKVKDDEAFLFVNYFGLVTNNLIEIIHKVKKNVVADFAHSFFVKPISGIPTFYSARKFQPVADGAYYYDPLGYPDNLQSDSSFSRSSYLFESIERDQQYCYQLYLQAEEELGQAGPKVMSPLTDHLLERLPYEKNLERRLVNYDYFQSKFDQTNELRGVAKSGSESPLCYPLLLPQGGVIRKYLIENRVFVPTYWENVVHRCNSETFEYHLATNLIPLPIDHRYDPSSLEHVVSLIESYQ